MKLIIPKQILVVDFLETKLFNYCFGRKLLSVITTDNLIPNSLNFCRRNLPLLIINNR